MANLQYAMSVLWMTALLLPAGCDPNASDLSLPSGSQVPSGPVVARVGGVELSADQVPILAGLANQLRAEFDLPVVEVASFEERLELAMELAALAAEAGSLPAPAPDQKRRLLARVYLKRLMVRSTDRPVTREELEQAHREVIESYLATRESEIYRPTTVDLVALRIGYFPDFHPPREGEQPLASRSRIESLLRRTRELAHRDLDEFTAMVRRLMAGNPTVASKDFSRLPLQAELSESEAIAYRVLKELKETGAVSQPVWTAGGAWIFRRGPTYPGQGEDLEEIRAELESRVIHKRKRNLYMDRMQELRERYQISTWSSFAKASQDRPTQ